MLAIIDNVNSGATTSTDQPGNKTEDVTTPKQDLIKLKEQELAAAQAIVAATPAEVAARNQKVEAIQNEIKALNELGTANQGKSGARLLDEAIKKRIDTIEAAHSAEVAAIKKRHLEGKTSEDQYNDELLNQEMKFLNDKMNVFKKGSKEYEEAFVQSLEKQVQAEKRIKDLIVAAEKELADAKIDNLEEGFDKEVAAENNRWENEEAALRKRLIEKNKLSKEEIALNDTINAIIEQKEAEHQEKIKNLKSGKEIADLESNVAAATPIDENFATLEQ